MDLTAITFTELRYIVAVADERHFGRAADACHVSQPTLSTQVKKLEENLGVQVFERTSRAVQVTPAGREILDRARTILGEVQTIGDLARGHAEPLAGPLRLGLIPTLGPYVLPWLVPQVQQSFPRLRLAVRESVTAQLLDELVRGQLDAALLALPVGTPGLVSEALFDEPFWVLAPATHPLATRARVAESDLEGQRVLLLTDGHCLREQALAICGQGAAAAGDDFRATSLETLRQLVAAGIGVTLLPALAVAALATLPTVAVRPFRAPAPSRRIGLVWRRGASPAPALPHLAAFIRTHAPAAVRPVMDGAAVVEVPRRPGRRPRA